MRWVAKQIAGWSVESGEEEYLIIVQYGIEVLVENIFRVVLILSVGIALGYGQEAAIALFSFAVLRMNAGGIHAESGIGCTVFTSSVVLSGILAEQYISGNLYLLLLFYVVSNILICRYAPNGCESCAMLDDSYKKKKKIYALITN